MQGFFFIYFVKSFGSYKKKEILIFVASFKTLKICNTALTSKR